MKQHKCRDCGTVQLRPDKILCEACKEKAAERDRAKKREWNKANPKRIRRPKPKEPQPPHKCATPNCQTMISARATFCRECRHQRQLIQQREYCRRRKHIDDPIPDEPPTNLNWLAGFNAYLKQNGGVYYRRAQ